MNRNLGKYVCLALFAALAATAACGGDDENNALRSPLAPSAVGDTSSMAEGPMFGAHGQSTGYPMDANGLTRPGRMAEGEKSECTAPATGPHWNQIAGRPRSGGVGIIRNRVEATFNGTDTLTRSGVCELAKQHLGDSGPWCETTGHTADWEASYAMLDQLAECRGASSTQQDPPEPQQQQGFPAITGWSCPQATEDNNRNAGPITVVPTTGGGTGWDIRVPENGGNWNTGNCYSLPYDIAGSALGTTYSFRPRGGGKVWLTAHVYDNGTRPIGLSYNQAIGALQTGANDNVWTGDRYSDFLTFRGERWRVVIVEDEVKPEPATLTLLGSGALEEGANLNGLKLRLTRAASGPVCFDLSKMADFRLAIDGIDRNNCVQVPGASRDVRLLGSHNDDNIVGPKRTYEISIDQAAGNTIGEAQQSVEFVVTDDDVLRLQPQSPDLSAQTGTFTLNIDVRMFGTPTPTAFWSFRVALEGAGVRGGSGEWTQTHSPGDWGGARRHNVSLDCTKGDATATFNAIAGSHARHLNPRRS